MMQANESSLQVPFLLLLLYQINETHVRITLNKK